MEINKTVNINLTEDEVKKIIADYVGKELNKSIRPEQVVFTIGKKYDNGIDDRFGTDYIKNCSVIYREK